MPKYEVNPGIEVPYEGEMVSHPTVVEGDFEHWARKRWVKLIGAEAGGSELPIPDYSKKTAKVIVQNLEHLTKSELKVVIGHESGLNRPRKSIIKEATRLLDQ